LIVYYWLFCIIFCFKIFPFLIVLTLAFSFLFQDTNIIQKDQEVDDKEVILSTLSTSDSIEYQWNVTWGGGGDDKALAIALDSSENIYLAGYTNDTISGDLDMCLVKFNNLGEYQWNSTWGGGGDDKASAIALDSSNNIYLAGTFYSLNRDLCLVKFNNLGEYQWDSTWDGGGDEEANAIALDSSENIYLAGIIGEDEDMCLVKFNNLGEYQWNRIWDGGGDDNAEAIALDSSENIYLAGGTDTSGIDDDLCLVKFNNLGEYQWNRTWDAGGDNGAGDIALDSSENIYLAGMSYSLNLDICLVKFNNLGEYQWNRTWDGGDDDGATTIVIDSLDNIYIGGATVIPGMNNFDFFLAGCDNLGFQQWNHTWGGSGDDIYWDVALDSLGNVYLAGTWADPYFLRVSDPDMVLTKFGKDEVIPSPKRPVIPGYGLIYIIGLLSVITTVKIIKKRRNFKIK